jgi:hypothetical protein
MKFTGSVRHVYEQPFGSRVVSMAEVKMEVEAKFGGGAEESRC